ncbi:hypothetical protein ZIOFF_062407 [Zingiber officinale]|uniref:Abscisic acid 8'-hydroxylase 1 n=1 Tax=Zingiber officinale TaxID=94328 RepID=A0A8J5F517_ZINOF|nr:hypothetical protein ZIOFF_062407 [Zingiber officinale]
MPSSSSFSVVIATAVAAAATAAVASGSVLLVLMPGALVFPFLLFLLGFFFSLALAFRGVLRGRCEGGGRLPLPPGSMGWPYIGETFQLYSNNPNAFFLLKQKRYGPIFKTHILGCPCVMVSSPEAARFVLVTQAHLFKPTFPASKERMIGPQAIFFQQGAYHAHLRRLVLRAFLPEAIRSSVAGIEAVALRSLGAWDGRLVNTFQELKTYAFNVAILSIFGKDEISSLEDLKQCYYTLEKGYNSMPINLPGTLFFKAMKARKQLALIVAKIVCSRRMQRKTSPNDLLGSFMETKEDLSDDQIADNVIGVIFAARDTTASVLTWIIKYLGDNPGILQAVTEEQEEIARSKGSEPLAWAHTKKMPLTSRVIQETMRVASILSFTFREAVEDVEYQGKDGRCSRSSETSTTARRTSPTQKNLTPPDSRWLQSLTPSCPSATGPIPALETSSQSWRCSSSSTTSPQNSRNSLPQNLSESVEYGAIPKWDTVWTFRAPHQWFAPQIRPQVSTSASSLTATYVLTYTPCSYPKRVMADAAALPGNGKAGSCHRIGGRLQLSRLLLV